MTTPLTAASASLAQKALENAEKMHALALEVNQRAQAILAKLDAAIEAAAAADAFKKYENDIDHLENLLDQSVAENERLREALRLLTLPEVTPTDPDGRCHFCRRNGYDGGHADDCVVTLARAALAGTGR